MPWAPNGYAVDMLRSCYRTRVRPFFDSDIQAEITWQFVPEDTPFVPGGTVFGSGNYTCKQDTWPGPGEVKFAKREYYRGGLLTPPVPLGLPAGLPEYRYGAPVSAAGSLVYTPSGVPLVCAPDGAGDVDDGECFWNDQGGDSDNGVSIWSEPLVFGDVDNGTSFF